MNSTQAKQISIQYFLERLNVYPIKTTGADLFYLSLFREEKTPSFKLNTQKNIWYDFGNGTGGNLIDLVMQWKKLNISNSLEFIQSISGNAVPTTNNSFFFSPAKDIQQQTTNITDFKVRKINNTALIEYLNQRRINIEQARLHCLEANYKNKGKHYYGIAFKNDSGGFEIRNKYSKVNLYGKDITTIKKSQKSNIVNIFEGFFDFLSYLTIYDQKPLEDFIILNTIALLKKGIELIKYYSEVNIYLDNDNAGKKATAEIKKIFPQSKDKSFIYSNFKDLNDLLTKNKPF